VVFRLLNQKLQKQFQLHPDCLWKFKNQYLLHNACAATTSYPFTLLVEVRGLPAPEGDLGGELELGGRVGIVDMDVHISVGFS
jgi:hypothetical protein